VVSAELCARVRLGAAASSVQLGEDCFGEDCFGKVKRSSIQSLVMRLLPEMPS
jgi:hypothetical protein